MLPVIMAAAQGKVLLHPDDLGPDRKLTLLQRRGDFSGIQTGMPDIGHIAGKERKRLRPVHPVIVLYRACLPLRAQAGFFPPERIVVHSIRADP